MQNKSLIFISILSFVLSLSSCGGSSGEKVDKDSLATVVVAPTNHIVLDSIHSFMKNNNEASVPTYIVSSADSFYIEMKDYNFYLPDPAFTYIRENIDYKKMVVSSASFAFVDVLSGDSTLSHNTVTFVKSEDNNSILVKIKDKRITDFTLAFRFYIDNGKGEQEIDKFKVKVDSGK